MNVWNDHRIGTWAEKTFGPSTPAVSAARANKEMAELLQAIARDEPANVVMEEIADVIICLRRLGAQLGATWFKDSEDYVTTKMETNVRRKWKVNNDGTAQHIPD